MREHFRIVFTPSNDCFFYLNERNLRSMLKGGGKYDRAIKVEFGEHHSQSMYASVSARPGPDIDDDAIGVNAQYAHLFRLGENDSVMVSNCRSSSIKKASVRPCKKEDALMAKKYASHLENKLLSQINIVSKNQNIPVNIFSNVTVMLRVEELEPSLHYGMLEECTELILSDALDADEIACSGDKMLQGQGNVNCSSMSETWKYQTIWNYLHADLKNFFNGSRVWFLGIKDNGDARAEAQNHATEASPWNKRKYTCRIRPLFCLKGEMQKKINGDKSKTLLVDFYKKKSCKVTKIDESAQDLKCATKSEEQGRVKSNAIVYFSCGGNTLGNDHYCPGQVMASLNLKVGSVVSIEESDETTCESCDGAEMLESACETQSDSEFIVTEQIKSIYDGVRDGIVNSVSFRETFSTLIIGNSGSGKTVLLTLLENFCDKNFIFFSKIDCKVLKGSKISYIKTFVNEKISELSRFRSSVLFVDDLDALTCDNEQGNTYTDIYCERFASLMLNAVTKYQKTLEFVIVATASSISKLDNFSTGHGPTMFETIREIGELQLDDRKTVLTELVKRKMTAEGDSDPTLIRRVAQKTRGYGIRDLSDVVEVAAVKCLARCVSSSGDEARQLTGSDFEAALDEKVPLFLNDVNANKESLAEWHEVGGMEDAKKVLIETFAWPFLYPKLFESCRLRHQTGVLLYGPPGTGKTLIAGAAAKKCGMNFIGVKGPEILSKYVGASEESVRNLFARARKARPCILFFDEFDSIAPKRGSHSGSVSATVVNQLLTELDGVEELTGVYVLAATSRPNLLDPALLRGGRIDKTVYCRLPQREERASILRASTRGLSYSHDVSFWEIAMRTEGYSGADLQALLYAAQAALIKEVEQNNGNGAMILCRRHLITALENTKPSISNEEAVEYENMYRAFNSKSGAAAAANDGVSPREQATMFR